MGGIDQIDIVRPFVYQFLKYGPQPGGRHLLPKALRTDLMILAEYTAQGTAAEKDRARPLRTTDTGLLPKMERRPGQTGTLPHPAVSLRSHTFAAAGAKRTNGHAVSSFYSAGKRRRFFAVPGAIRRMFIQ